MPFDIEQFQSSLLSRGTLRPNKHQVRIFPPQGIDLPNDIAPELEFWGETTDIPLFQLGTHQVMRHGYGSRELRPFMPVYQEWQVVFRVDADGHVWRFFKEWNKAIVANDVQTTPSTDGLYEVAYKDDYAADMNVTVFNNDGGDAINVVLIEAFPMTLGSIHVDWSDNQAYMRLPVVFSFVDWIESTSN
jgi:hypothetical protein